MQIRRVVPNIVTDCIDESLDFYTGLLGFRVAMDMEWIMTLVSPDNTSVQLSLVRGETAAPGNLGMTLTVEVDDVDRAYADASSGGYDIVYQLTDEPWGVRRFHLRDPNGVVINVMSHRAKS